MHCIVWDYISVKPILKIIQLSNKNKASLTTLQNHAGGSPMTEGW